MHGHRSTEWEKLKHEGNLQTISFVWAPHRELLRRTWRGCRELSGLANGSKGCGTTRYRDAVCSLQFSVFCIVARCEVKHPETHDTHNTCQHHIMKEQCSLACATSAYLERIWILQKPPAKKFSFSTERKTGKDCSRLQNLSTFIMSWFELSVIASWPWSLHAWRLPHSLVVRSPSPHFECGSTDCFHWPPAVVHCDHVHHGLQSAS